MKIYQLILLVMVVIFLSIIGAKYGFKELNTKDNNEQVKVVKQVDDELQKIMDEENFKKATILRARKVANDNKKTIELERNKKALDLIEAEYESIRNEELLLVGEKDVSLK